MGWGRAGRTAAFLVLLSLTACADRDGAGPGAAGVPQDDDALVLRVELTGGFVPPETIPARLPLVSVHGDGRVLLEGPVEAIHPGPAWPNVQVVDVGRDGVRALADRALAAGVAETGDLGMPPLADAPSTRFTLVTSGGTHVREVYALTEAAGLPRGGLTEAQEAAREELRALLGELTDLGLAEPGKRGPRPWTPDAVAAVVRPWTASEDDVAHGLVPAPVPWPGPALPGEALGASPGLSCVVAEGEQAEAVIGAARNATALTPWSAPDGTRWSALFRPLLPDESGCADLPGQGG
ncbi:hypothetical protein [Blastococcus deserti]|uniref:Uncharacterized protein n=1 Tax=Blastococcus deserti TaxID=2259033 RepID=A0ABW4X5A7_9ACTN